MKSPKKPFALCLDDSDYKASLIRGKVYQIFLMQDGFETTVPGRVDPAKLAFGHGRLDIRCHSQYHHRIMPRTTLDIDTPILRELKKLQAKERRSLGKIASQLLAEALGRRKAEPEAAPLRWVSRPMGALVDLSDKDALYDVVDARDT